MFERVDSFLYKMRFIVIGLLVMSIAFVILGILFAGFKTTSAQGLDQNSGFEASSSFLDSPNVVSAGFMTAGHSLGAAMGTMTQGASGSVHFMASTATGSVKAVGHSGVMAVGFVGHSIGSTMAFTAGAVANVTTFIFRIPTNVFRSISVVSVVGSVIRPADHNPVPIIDPNSPALAAAKQALPAAPAASPAAPQPSPVVVWPLHGIITTQFGVPELPYEAIHTGLDISDGRPSGTTSIKAFRQGRVIATEHTGGLGNHVIVDHGNGVTSVYGHLASISVSVGQEVDTSTTLGFEGTTGVSTGVHLHFEIRVNGQATDPHQFISGQP